MSHHGEAISDIILPQSRFYQGPYGRMFRNLPAHVPTLDLIKGVSFEGLPDDIAEEIRKILPETEQDIKPERLKIIARNGLDAKNILKEVQEAHKQDTEAGQEAILKLLARTMIEPPEQSEDPARDNIDIPAGYTYFSQFITHDITFDPTSSLIRFNDPNKLRNFRTPRLDLDSLYGNGPEDSPYLYDQHNHGKLLVEKGTRALRHRENASPKTKIIFRLEELAPNDEISEITHQEDLPRNSQGRAFIGDPRNDENIIISQLQLAFIKFHNKVMEYVTNEGIRGKNAFYKAQRLVCWHYQWVVLHDFLPKIVEEEVLEQIWEAPDCFGQPKLCFYQWRNQPFIPVEFSVAAFRFGHSMIRSSYDLNDMIKGLTIIDCKGPGSLNLMGSRPLPTNWTIQWDRFLNINGSVPQKSRQIDTRLSFPLSQFPSPLGTGDCHNLAAFDLLRGYRMDLPSGQAVAKAMGLRKEDILDGPEAPLWYYILREAEQKHKGRKLGPVGSRIVAEVIIGLLAGDPHSFLNVEPRWKPGLPLPQEEPFGLPDILRHAEISPTE
jgi:hypothetical protein